MNNEMNDLAVKNGLPHWKCISLKSNKWWRRDDGAEYYTVESSSIGYIFDSLRKLDRRFHIGSNVVELEDSMPDNSRPHAKKLLPDIF